MDIIIKNNCCIHSTRLIQEEFHNPKVSRRLFLQKRKKENIRNVPKNQKQNNKEQTTLTHPKCYQFQSPRSCSYKKERKRTLETFPKVKNKTTKRKYTYPPGMSPISKFKKPFLQKRKKENVRNVPKNQKQNNKE